MNRKHTYMSTNRVFSHFAMHMKHHDFLHPQYFHFTDPWGERARGVDDNGLKR